MMFMNNFPQELVDHIIDQLYDDPRSLQACSRVCKSWLPASRFHLFTKVSLKAASMHGPALFPSACCKRLLSVIEQSPEISSCIRELELCEGTPLFHTHPPQGVGGAEVPLEAHATTWAFTEPALFALFKRLKNLRRLDFASTSTIYWKSLPASFQNAFCSLLATSKSLTYLRLHSWSFPSHTSLALLLSHCKNLKGLSLSSTMVNDDDSFEQHYHLNHRPRLRCVIEEDVVAESPDSTVIHRRSTNLEVLTLDFVTFANGYLGSWLFSKEPSSTVDISRLRELRVAHFPDISIIERLLVSVGSSLEHLHLKPGCWNVKPFDLSHNTGLRSLRLTLEEPDTALAWTTSFLASLSSPSYYSSSATIADTTSLTTITNTSTASRIPLERIGLEFYIDIRKLDCWVTIASLLLDLSSITPLSSSSSVSPTSSLKQVEIGLFASPNNPDFIRAEKSMSVVRERGVDVRIYQLGLKSQRSSRQLMPRVCRWEG